MNIQAKYIKEIIFVVLISGLFLPLLQELLSFGNEKPLKGAIVEPNRTEFSFGSWFSGDFQTTEEKYLNESFGFRTWAYRLHNQVLFWLFKKTNARSVVVGKNNYLFESDYIKAYYGDDFIGEDKMSARVQKLKFISDTLERLNKKLVIVFAPNKARFFPEYIPDAYSGRKKQTNYEVFIDQCNTNNIRFIDFNKYYILNKQKSKFPLFPRYGVHWSYYGSCIVADSMVRYFEGLNNIDLPDIGWERVVEKPATGMDVDIVDGMNLLISFEPDLLGYPELKINHGPGKEKLSILVISDSFFWSIYDLGFSDVFSRCSFWYYNKEVYPESFKNILGTNHLNFKKELLDHDFIILMSSEAQLPEIGWGFIEKANDMFKGLKIENLYTPEFMVKVRKLKEYIKTDQKWMEEIKTKALNSGITVDSVLTIDAIWMVENEKK